MFGSKVRYGVSYKTNQKSFEIYRRKYWHDFKVPLSDDNLENSIGLELNTMDAYLVAKIDTVTMYDVDSFEGVDTIPIQLMKADTREPNQVIAMQKCPNEEYLAIISGKILIMNEQQTNQLFIFKRVRENNPKVKDKFVLHKRIVLREIDIFKKVCMSYHFKTSNTKNAIMDTIIFCKQDCIFELNFETEDKDAMIKVVYTFEQPLNRQPLFF